MCGGRFSDFDLQDRRRTNRFHPGIVIEPADAEDAVTATLMTQPSFERSGGPGRGHAQGERWLVAACDPENATPREAMMFAAYGVQINRCR